jgi:hypothetical protein
MQVQISLHGQKLAYGKSNQESQETTHIKHLPERKMTVISLFIILKTVHRLIIMQTFKHVPWKYLLEK